MGSREIIEFFIIDINNAGQMYDACEPLFMLGGKVYKDMLMNFENLKNKES